MRPHLHLRDEDAAGQPLPEEGGWLTKGSQTPGKGVAGRVTRDQVRTIAEQKLKDLNARDVDAAMRMVEGSARSMGLEVVG
jgi:large subunit ribosomal protein L11